MAIHVLDDVQVFFGILQHTDIITLFTMMTCQKLIVPNDSLIICAVFSIYCRFLVVVIDTFRLYNMLCDVVYVVLVLIKYEY